MENQVEKKPLPVVDRGKKQPPIVYNWAKPPRLVYRRKKLTMYRKQPPEVDGFPDQYKLKYVDNGELIAEGYCGTNPNANFENKALRKNPRWKTTFGQIAAHSYSFTCEFVILAHSQGKGLRINGQGHTETTNYDVKNKGYYATGVLVHWGDSNTNRGSTACCTIPDSKWPAFIALFEFGESGDFELIDESTPWVEENDSKTTNNKLDHHSGLHSVFGELYGSKEVIDNITFALDALVTKSQKYNQIFDIKSNVKKSALALCAPAQSNNSQPGVQSITKLYVKLNWNVEGVITTSK